MNPQWRISSILTFEAVRLLVTRACTFGERSRTCTTVGHANTAPLSGLSRNANEHFVGLDCQGLGSSRISKVFGADELRQVR